MFKSVMARTEVEAAIRTHYPDLKGEIDLDPAIEHLTQDPNGFAFSLYYRNTVTDSEFLVVMMVDGDEYDEAAVECHLQTTNELVGDMPELQLTLEHICLRLSECVIAEFLNEPTVEAWLTYDIMRKYMRYFCRPHSYAFISLTISANDPSDTNNPMLFTAEKFGTQLLVI